MCDFGAHLIVGERTPAFSAGLKISRPDSCLKIKVARQRVTIPR